MRRLSVEHVMSLHTDLVIRTGGSDGVRDMGLLESAINAPFQSFGGYDMYPSLEEKAARLAYGLAQNHAFIDGNKRIAAHAMLVFLAANGIETECTDDELYSLFLGLADSSIKYDNLASWIRIIKTDLN